MKITDLSKISDLQMWADWPAEAGSKKWAAKLENFVSIGNFPYFLPISYCLPGPANRPTFAKRKFSIKSAIFIHFGKLLGLKN